MLIYDTMYLSRKLAYNKKETFSFPMLNVYLYFRWDTYSNANECHFFISITNIVKRNKMITMYLRTFIIKILFDILSNLLSLKIRGRHSTTEIFPIYNYTIN